MNQEGRPGGQKHGQVGAALWWDVGGEGSRRRERGWEAEKIQEGELGT